MKNMNNTFLEVLKSGKAPQTGKWGEMVFEGCAEKKYKDIKPMHSRRCDFIVNGKKVDVKSSKKSLSSDLGDLVPWKGKRYPGIEYGKVEFYSRGARVSIEDEIIENASRSDLESIYKRWQDGKFKRPPSRKRDRRIPSDIKETIKAIFESEKLPAPYLLHRSVMFLKESPHNLLPSQRRAIDSKGWTVFLQFKSAPPRLKNISKIIAFPDNEENFLPRLQKTRLGGDNKYRQKADLSKIPKKYILKKLEDLKSFIKECRDEFRHPGSKQGQVH
jgi:hypothetical protein